MHEQKNKKDNMTIQYNLATFIGYIVQYPLRRMLPSKSKLNPIKALHIAVNNASTTS